jgi:hypothetical protein
MNYF